MVMVGRLRLGGIVDSKIQGSRWFGFLPHWYIFPQFIAFFIYLMAAFAETNRIPFDLPESETELVAGYPTEYSPMKFAMFFFPDDANTFTLACSATCSFF